MMVACERMYVRAREREKVCVCDAAAAATKLEEQSFNLAASEEAMILTHVRGNLNASIKLKTY